MSRHQMPSRPVATGPGPGWPFRPAGSCAPRPTARRLARNQTPAKRMSPANGSRRRRRNRVGHLSPGTRAWTIPSRTRNRPRQPARSPANSTAKSTANSTASSPPDSPASRRSARPYPTPGPRRRSPSRPKCPCRATHRTATHRTATHRAATHRTATHRAATHRTSTHRTSTHQTATHRTATCRAYPRRRPQVPAPSGGPSWPPSRSSARPGRCGVGPAVPASRRSSLARDRGR
jgi:hypothetical protein